MNTNFIFGLSPGQFYFLLPHVKPWLMPIGLNSHLENIIPCPTMTWVLQGPNMRSKHSPGLQFLTVETFYTRKKRWLVLPPTAIINYSSFTNKLLFMLTVIYDTCDVVYNWSISPLPPIVLDNLFGF